jgi:hypothetical protein
MATDTSKLLSMPFVDATLDPTVIPGVYNTCDEWCAYCPVTARCLAYRCRPPGDDSPGGCGIYLNIADRLRESMEMVRELHAADGRVIPELEELLNDRSEPTERDIPAGDALNDMARRYAITAGRYLQSLSDVSGTMQRRPEGPTALEVFAWFHFLIAAKVCRAIVSRAAAAREARLEGREADLGCEALYSAKVALIGIDRSRQALRELQRDDANPRLAQMEAQLRRLAKEVDGRFPGARAVLRPGLDIPAPVGRRRES